MFPNPLPPKIHGKGRIIFSGFEIATVPIGRIRQIPGGPPLDEEFIREGADILNTFLFYDLPYILTTFDPFGDCYWIIDGRHRLESYKLTKTEQLTILVGRGMRVLDKGLNDGVGSDRT